MCVLLLFMLKRANEIRSWGGESELGLAVEPVHRVSLIFVSTQSEIKRLGKS